MSTRLLLIAHAGTSATRHATFARGEGLDPRGLQTALASAARLQLRPDVVWSSPAPAARETAEALGFEAQVDDALCDLDVGLWTGRSFSEIAQEQPDQAAAWMTDPTYASHGGESIDALIGRVAVWLAPRRSAKGMMVAVTHAAVVRAALLLTLDAPRSAFWRVDVAPLAHIVLGTNSQRWTLRAQHLG